MSSPLTFPSAAVPIIGRPFEIKSWHATVLVTCNCGAHEPIMLVGLSVATCPACGRGARLQSLAFDGATGECRLNLATVHPNQTPN